MQSKLNDLLESPELVEKILYHYNIHDQKTSHMFLMHKFKLNSHIASKIMEIVNQYEKENGIYLRKYKGKKKFLKNETRIEPDKTYLKKIYTEMSSYTRD